MDLILIFFKKLVFKKVKKVKSLNSSLFTVVRGKQKEAGHEKNIFLMFLIFSRKWKCLSKIQVPEHNT